MSRKKYIILTVLVAVLGVSIGFCVYYSIRNPEHPLLPFMTASRNPDQMEQTYSSELQEHCEEVIQRFSGDSADFLETSYDTVNGKQLMAYVFEDEHFRYQVTPDRNYMLYIESIDNAALYKKSQAETLMRDFLDIRYDLQTVWEETGYLHLKETQNGIDTGTYAIFVFDENDAVRTATFFKGSNYDVSKEDMIPEEEAYQAALEAIRQTDIIVMGKKIRADVDQPYTEGMMEITAILDHLYYTTEIVWHPSEEDELPIDTIYLYPQIDVYTGACTDISVGY